jgi:hypothetical protein
MSTKKSFNFPQEHLNIGVILHAIQIEGLDCQDQIESTSIHHEHLEKIVGNSIPDFDNQVKRLRKKYKWRTIEELEKKLGTEKTEEFDKNGYVDLNDYDLAAKTLYLINFAYCFFNRIDDFKEQTEINLNDYIQECADHTMESILKGSQTLDSRFTLSNDCPIISYMTALVSQTENIKILSEWKTLNYVLAHKDELSILLLGRFAFEIFDNLLTLNDDFANGSYSYHY